MYFVDLSLYNFKSFLNLQKIFNVQITRNFLCFKGPCKLPNKQTTGAVKLQCSLNMLHRSFLHLTQRH